MVCEGIDLSPDVGWSVAESSGVTASGKQAKSNHMADCKGP